MVAPAGASQQTLTNPPNNIKLTVRGKADGMLGRGRVSPDGKSSRSNQLVKAGGTGNLAIWDTQTSETRIVNRFSNAVPWADGFAEASIWAPDAAALAYSWAVEGRKNDLELRIVVGAIVLAQDAIPAGHRGLPTPRRMTCRAQWNGRP